MEFEITRRDFTISSASLVVGAGGGYFVGSRGSEGTDPSDTEGTDNTNNQDDDQTTTTTDENEENTDKDKIQNNLTIKDRPRMGELGSEIHIVYWTDYKCPFCNRFSTGALPQIIDELINNGDVTMIFKPVGVIKETSIYGALAANCVWEKGLTGQDWIDWSEDLMDRYLGQDDIDEVVVAGEVSEQYGLNGAEIERCINDETYMDRTSTDYTEARDWGFTGTPYFLLYNTNTYETDTITGNQPYEAFYDAVNNLKE